MPVSGPVASFFAGLTGLAGLPLAIASPWADSSLAPILAADIFGIDPTAGGAVMPTGPYTRGQALRIPSVARCHRLIIGATSGIALVANGGPTPELLRQLEPGTPAPLSVTRLVDQLLWHGVAYMLPVTRGADGRPERLQIVDAPTIRWDDGQYVHTPAGNGAPRRLAPVDVVRVDAVCPGVLETGAVAMRRAAIIEAAADRAAGNPVPSVELHQTSGAPLGADERAALILAWQRARNGANGGVAYTSPGVEARTHGQAAEQLLIDGRNHAALDVARAFGLPAWAVDASVAGTSLTYTSVPARARELVDYVLSPYLDAIAWRLSMADLTPPGVWLAWDTDRLTRGDLAARMTAYETGIRAQVMTPDQARALESGATATWTR